MTETWRKAIDNGKTVGVLFIDFKKAFDTVSHPVLLKKLSAYGISGNFHDYLSSYLTDRKQCTILNNSKSNYQQVPFGVPQGSIAGPPLFSANVNDMHEHLETDLDLFADDSTSHITSDSVGNALKDLQIAINNLKNYSNRNSLTIHPDKCKIMLFTKSPFIGPLPSITIDGTHVKIVNSTKCLGINIDNRLTWDVHTQKVSKSFSKKLKNLYHMRAMSKETLSTIYFQGILPAVIYGIIIWGNCTPNQMSSIEKIHIRAARFINRIKHSVSDSKVLEIVNWHSIQYYYKRSIACKAYKIYNSLTSPLLDRLIIKSSKRSASNSMRLDLPSFKYVNFKNAFSYRVANVWNNLPIKLRKSATYDAFKRALKKSDVLDMINFGCNQTGKALKYKDYIYY